jgi:ATP-dependent protease ClpP protease subunit
MQKRSTLKIDPSRSLFLNSGFSEKDANILVKQLFDLNQSKGKIFLQMNCNGGSFAGAKKLYDNICLSPNPVYGVVAGNAFSGAPVVLQACYKRYATNLSKFLIHHISYPISFDIKINDKISDLNDFVAEEMLLLKTNESIMVEILEKRMKINRAEIETILDKDIEFTALDAEKLGLIDEIIYLL